MPTLPPIRRGTRVTTEHKGARASGMVTARLAFTPWFTVRIDGEPIDRTYHASQLTQEG